MNSMSGFKGPSGGNISNRPAGRMQSDIVPKGFNKGQLSQFTPEQMQLFQQLFSNVSPDSSLGQLAGGDESSFEQMEAPAWRQFSQAQGQLGSRFSQLQPGAMSAQRGSGFQNQAGQLGSDFAMDLASRRQQLQQQAIKDLMGLGQELLGQRPYEKFLSQKPQKQSSALGGFGGALGSIGGGALGFALGGPGGAISGASLGGRALSGI